MRAHQRHGFTHSDVVDYALRNCNKPTSPRRRPIFTSLAAAHAHITNARKWLGNVERRDDHIRFARDYLRKAAEWRNEIAAR